MTAEATVNDIISDARSFASESFNSATNLINSAQNAASGFVLLDPRELRFNTGAVPELDETADPGTFDDAYVPPATRPDSPTLLDPHIPVLPNFPDAPDALDTSDLFQFDRPTFDLGEFDKSSPILDLDIPIPDAPTIVEYDAPEVNPLDIRETPSVTVPRFDEDTTLNLPGDVDDLADRYETELQNAIPEFRNWVETYADSWIDRYAPEYQAAMAQLEAKLSDGYGGETALPDTVEQRIFDRGVRRVRDERTRADEEAAEAFAKRGHDLAPGVLFGALHRNSQAVTRESAGVARDTAIERARLETQHIQFVMQLSGSIRDGLRGQVIAYSNLLLNVNGQAIQHAQTIGNFVAQAYQLTLQRAQLEQSRLQTLAQIFETELKSAIADLEVFRIELEAAKTKKDAELADFAVWEKRIDAQQTKINLYLAQLRGVAEAASIQRLKIDIFGEEVRAYLGLVSAKESEFNAYKAAIDGDTARVNAHAQVVRTYSAEVDAAGTKIDAESKHTDAIVQYNRNLTDIFRSELQAYGADVDAESRRFTSGVDAYRAQLARYREVLSAQISELRIQYEKETLDLRAATAELDADVKTLLTQGQLFQSQLKLRADTAMSGASAFGSMASSAVSAQNTMVSLVNETLQGS